MPPSFGPVPVIPYNGGVTPMADQEGAEGLDQLGILNITFDMGLHILSTISYLAAIFLPMVQ